MTKQDYQENDVIEVALLPAPLAVNCTQLKIGEFISILCEEMEKPEAWIEIYDEFFLLTKGNANNAVLELKKQEVMFRNAFKLIDMMIQMVCLDQSLPGYLDLNDALRKITRIRAKGKIDADELQRHINVRTSYGEKLKEKIAEIDALEAGDSDRSTRKDWMRQLSMLGKYQGYRMNPMEVSVSEYCATLSEFKEDNKPKKGFKYNS